MKILKHFDSDKQHLNGQEVTLIRVVTEPDGEIDEEALPMVYVKLVNPRPDQDPVLLVWPDELDTPLEDLA